ncbi:hypothetical protein H6G81_28955 [Scytonema hofmannii FACHB-248]|uniref:Uncharacterized protein n=1 Tax=Scytonema hofmannii FACHB-248 TaxID=1842502 RepID=A0ABR8GZC5_9CYAN|nr:MULTISPECIES: hypothetical protein [Nostocales]MBD2608440.1 hypothetical protein [Scytonema hofmannii FACHB-248]
MRIGHGAWGMGHGAWGKISLPHLSPSPEELTAGEGSCSTCRATPQRSSVRLQDPSGSPVPHRDGDPYGFGSSSTWGNPKTALPPQCPMPNAPCPMPNAPSTVVLTPNL